jgi:catalase
LRAATRGGCATRACASRRRAWRCSAPSASGRTRGSRRSPARAREHVGAVSTQAVDDDAPSYRFNPLDLTKVWPHGDHPPIKVGRIVLDRNPQNYFAEVDQAAFEPANMVPASDRRRTRCCSGACCANPDMHRYRIGPNYLQLPVNRPQCPVHSYNRDGAMR